MRFDNNVIKLFAIIYKDATLCSHLMYLISIFSVSYLIVLFIIKTEKWLGLIFIEKII